MARWYLTSDEDIDQKASQVCESAGLNSSASTSGLEYFVQAYEKRVTPNTNFVYIGDNDWICSAGTLISNGEMGEPVLRKMHKHFLKDGIHGARSDVIGHYAVALKHGDCITVFTDPHGAFRLYYSTDGRPWLVTNSLYMFGKCIEPPTVDPISAIGYAIQLGETGEDTFYSTVKRIFGSQALRISIPDSNLSVFELAKSNIELSSYSDISGAVTQYRKEIRDVFDHLRTVDSIALNTTGGLDSRTLLAILFDRRISPQLLYGIGNSGLTNTKRSDLEVSKELSEMFNLPFYQMDWLGNHPHSVKQLESDFKKYGFNYLTYGVPESLLEELRGGISPYPTLQIAGYGPVFTNMKIWDSEKHSFSFNDLVESYIWDFADHPSFTCTDEYRAHIQQSILEALSHTPIHYPEEGASLETFVKARVFLKIRSAAGALNFFNEFTNFIAPFMMKRLHDPLLNVPMEYRKSDEIQVRLIHSTCPDVFEAPIFSGIKPAVIDLESFTMQRPLSFRLRRRVLGSIREFLPNQIEPKAHKIHQQLTSDPDDKKGIDERIRQNSTEYILSNSLVSSCIRELSDLDIVRLNNLHRTLFGIDHISDHGLDLDDYEEDC